MFLLDTNVVSELRRARAGLADANVCAWAAALAPASAFISVMTVLELELGVLRIARRDMAQGATMRLWFEKAVLNAFAGRILTVGLGEVRRCAPLHVPNPRPYYDALIAATALSHGLALATRNVRDFEGLGVRLMNPWEHGA
jgi:hypothetical protein